MEVQKVKLGFIVITVVILFYGVMDALADVTSTGATTNTQTNTSGSNTTITGGYSQETTNTYSGGQTNTTTNTTNNSTNQETAVNSASAPSMSVYGQDSCVIPLSAGWSVIGFSGSFGSYIRDDEHESSINIINVSGQKCLASYDGCRYSMSYRWFDW